MSDLPFYTLAQVRGFLAAGVRQQAAHDARQLALQALAHRGEGRQLEQTLAQWSRLAGMAP